MAAPDSTRSRLLEATGRALARCGPHRLTLTNIAALAGVSRPTLYRHFASKDDLLIALAAHEKQRFEEGLASALQGLAGRARLERALHFVAEFQRTHDLRGLVAVEPAFMLDQLERAQRSMAAALVPVFEQLPPARRPGPAGPADLADLVVRVAVSHFLMPGDDSQLLRELRHAAGIHG